MSIYGYNVSPMKRCLLSLMVMCVGVSSQGTDIANTEESLAFPLMFDMLMVVGKVVSYQGSSMAIWES